MLTLHILHHDPIFGRIATSHCNFAYETISTVIFFFVIHFFVCVSLCGCAFKSPFSRCSSSPKIVGQKLNDCYFNVEARPGERDTGEARWVRFTVHFPSLPCLRKFLPLFMPNVPLEGGSNIWCSFGYHVDWIKFSRRSFPCIQWWWRRCP